jgi:hypothetical protein
MSTEPTTPQALLARAAEVITERGWYQGSWTNDEGCVCTWGALNVAAAEAAGLDLDAEAPKPPDPDFFPARLYNVYVAAEMDLLNAISGGRDDVDGCRGIAEWNDTPGRTQDEVQDLLRCAAGGAL